MRSSLTYAQRLAAALIITITMMVVIPLPVTVSETEKAADTNEHGQPGVYRAYPGPKRPDDEVATLLVPEEGWLIFRNDEKSPTGWVRASASVTEKMEVLPGTSDFSWGRRFDNADYCRREAVTLEAGHSYTLGFKGHRRGLFGDLAHMWLEDTTTQEIVAGVKPDKQLLPGQVNPTQPYNFRQVVEHITGECFFLSTFSGNDSEVLVRRERIIELGDKFLASSLKKNIVLRAELEAIVMANEEIPASGCPLGTTVKKRRRSCGIYLYRDCCELGLEKLQLFIEKVERKSASGKVDPEPAADLVSTARSLIPYFEASSAHSP